MVGDDLRSAGALRVVDERREVRVIGERERAVRAVAPRREGALDGPAGEDGALARSDLADASTPRDVRREEADLAVVDAARVPPHVLEGNAELLIQLRELV